MASSKIECLWQLLSTNDFKEDIPEKFHCILCHNVAIEPFTAFCKCRFCSKCIKEYLKDSKKHCPGIKNDCAEEYLEIDVNILKDLRGICSLRRISVKCPNKMCEVKCHLEEMNDHLRVCGMSKTICPYENIGCQLRQISRDNVKTHYENEWFFHTKLLIDAIDNLRRDVEELKKVVERRDEEINKLKEDSVMKEKKIQKEKRKMEDTVNDGNIITIIDEMKKESSLRERQITSKIQELKREEINHLTEDLKIKEVMINEIKEQVNDQRKEIEKLKIKDERRVREIEVMKETQKKMIKVLENVKKDIVKRDVKADIEDQKKSLNNFRVNQENIEREINSVIIKVRDARIFDEREYMLKVNDFSKMREDGRMRRVILWRYSLKLCLHLRCHVDYLEFGCRILKGEFDDDLEWPMKHKITLSLINQATAKSYKSVEYRCDSFRGSKSAFDKPRNDKWNFPFSGYFDNFTTIKEITDTPGLLLDNSVIVSFNIDYN